MLLPVESLGQTLSDSQPPAKAKKKDNASVETPRTPTTDSADKNGLVGNMEVNEEEGPDRWEEGGGGETPGAGAVSKILEIMLGLYTVYCDTDNGGMGW